MIATIKDYLTDLHLEFFSEGIELLADLWLRVVASLGVYSKLRQELFWCGFIAYE